MSLDIKKTRIERVVIECPMEEAKDAIAWVYDNGYGIARGGWSGPALSKKKNGNMLDQTRYHTEGEKEIEETVPVFYIDGGRGIPSEPIPTLDEYTEERFIRELKEIGLPQETIDSSLKGSRSAGQLSVSNYNSSITYDGEHCGLVNWCPHCDRLRMTTGPDGHIRYCYTCRGVTGPGNMA